MSSCIPVIHPTTEDLHHAVVLTGLPASTLAPLRRVLHAAARLVLDLRPRDTGVARATLVADRAKN